MSSDASKRKLSDTSSSSVGVVPQKRKRKTFSCTSCRKLKTRCDFEPQFGKCHRCNVLKLDCSLTYERRDEIESAVLEQEENNNNNNDDGGGDLGKDKTGVIKNDTIQDIHDIKTKLDKLYDVLVLDKDIKQIPKKSNSDYEYFKGMKSKVNYLDNSINNAPWNVINRIDFKLFKKFKKYEFFEKLCKEEFLQGFYFENQDFCLKLANNFLTKAHFWIIPGGLTKIDSNYILKNPFISSVFILISLNFDHQEIIKTLNEDELQKKLFWIVRKLLGLSMTITPLSDHDIEAILYCSIYNIARSKSEQQPQLDNWNVSGNGIKQMMILTRFNELEKRVKQFKVFDLVDLFHLRIWNSLCISHIQNSIGMGRPFVMSEDYFKICELILQYPQINIEDQVRFAELQISKKCFDMFYESDLMLEVIRLDQFIIVDEEFKVIELAGLKEWFHQNEVLIDQDISNVLMFCYEFYHIILTKRIISSFGSGQGHHDSDFRVVKFQKIGLNSIIYYSHGIINRFLKLKSFLIKGSPNFILNLIIYTSLTLYENLNQMQLQTKNLSINLITKIYWRLNQIGEMKNDATDTVGKIIKNLVLDNLGPTDPSSTVNINSNSGGDKFGKLVIEEDQDFEYEPLHDDVNHGYSNDYNVFRNQQQQMSSMRSTTSTTGSVTEQNNGLFEIPDVGKFDTFEDFFRDMFTQHGVGQ